MKIFVPIDGSEFTDRTLDHLATHAGTMSKADTFLLMFVSAPMPLHVASGMSGDELLAYYADEAGEATSASLRRLDALGWIHRLLTVMGVSSAEICNQATTARYDLIVIGTHGRGAVGCLRLGSTSQQVLARCQVPILLIR